MPAGCDFTCKNKSCDYYDTGFSFTGPWPMGNIDEVINSQKVQGIPELIEQMKQLKDTGREYVCITFPNVDEIEANCYRVQRWSTEEKCLWQYDVVKSGDEDMETALNNADIPTECPNTGGKMLSYNEAIKDGVDCPSCSKKLTQKRWSTKEI